MLNFIVNKRSSSGNADSVWNDIEKILKEKCVKYTCWETKEQGHASRIVSSLCENTEDELNIVVVGGDGTINEAINGITDFDRVRFGIIPTGSGNDFARGMGINKNLSKCVEHVVKSREDVRIDLGLVKYKGCEEGHYFGISSGVGMDALVCKKAETSKIKKVLNKLHLGKLTYLIITVWSLFSMETSDMEASLGEKDKLKLNKLIFVAFMNFKAEGGGVYMAPKADVLDGKLSVCVCSGVSKFGALLRLPLLVIKKHEKLKCFRLIECENGKLKLKTPMTLHADGEYLGEVDYVEYKCEKAKLRFMK